ncbi:MAG: hypothetical protein FWG45_03630 [Oscillospiraceae bacterium]|nr:hypothetical protein [Oscillospiraceae bacterium]
MILFLKIVMYFVAAIWGLVLGCILPVGMLAFPEGDSIPAYIPVMWIIACVAGFIAPCVLVRLKRNKIAAGLSIAGAAVIIVVHFALDPYTIDDSAIAWFYMPLLAETVAVSLIAWGDIAESLRAKHDAPAESILGKIDDDDDYVMKSYDKPSKSTNKSKKRKRRK